MSVIWSGITEQGAIVPVQVDETGRVVSVSAEPSGDFVEKTGDNMTGPLTFDTDKIALNPDGSFRCVGAFQATSSFRVVNEFDDNPSTGKKGVKLSKSGAINITGKADKSALFIGVENEVGDSTQQTLLIETSGEILIGDDAKNAPATRISPNGSASFAKDTCGFTPEGEIYFTSRNERYRLIVSNSLVTAEPY